MTTGPAVKGIQVITLATVPFGSRISTAIIISGSAAVSDQTIASCCASRMLLPSEPVPSIRPPKNRNAMTKNGSASASASHGTSTRADISIGTTPSPVTISIVSQTAICSRPAPPRPSSLPARI